MLDILGAMTLTAIAALYIGVLAFAGTRDKLKRRGLVVLGGLWFVTIASLGASGVFLPSHAGTPAIGAAVLFPLLVGLVVFARSRPARAFALAVPLTTLVGIHVGRLLGVAFLVLHSAGRLPPTFAMTAGWGDIFVAAVAAPLAFAIHRRTAGWWSLTMLWNTIGTLDLVTAVTLGVGSAPNSPVRFIFESPNTGALATLPWVMVPGFFVPLYLLAHAAIFAQLARAAGEERVSLAARRGRPEQIPVS